MVMERAERRIAANLSGVSNLTYDLIAALKSKLDEITIYEVYKRDASEAGESRAERFFDQGQRDAQEAVRQLREMVKEQLDRPMTGDAGVRMSQEISPARDGGNLKPESHDDLLDDTVDDSFPASDPPSYTATSTA
jgi:hypothetical protein